MSNVLVISTSLRAKSNSDILAKSLIQGARDAGHTVQQRIHRIKAALVIDRAGDPVDIVVIHEVVKLDIAVNSAVCAALAVDGIVDLEEILVIVGRPDTLVALIIRCRIEHFRVCPTVVVAVDDLAHEPEFGISALAEGMDALEEIEVDAVSRIKADAVDLEFLHPVRHSVQQIIADILSTLDDKIELNNKINDNLAA